MNKQAKMTVIGRVQGVGFRFFVYNEAIALNLTGYVRNLYNGDVEIVAEGDQSAIHALLKSVRVGPRLADVTSVDVTWLEEPRGYKGFQILH